MRTDINTIISRGADQTKLKLVEVGAVTKVDGVEGHVLVKLKPDSEIDVFDDEFLLVEVNGGIVPMRIDDAKRRGERSATITLNNATTVAQAQYIVGGKVYGECGEREEGDDEYEMTSFTGYTIIDTTLGKIGVITDIDDTVAANPLFIVDGAEGEILIPASDDFVEEVDDDARTITMNLPAGLVDIDAAPEV